MEHAVTSHKLINGAKLLTVQIPNTITFYWGSYFRAGFRYAPLEKYEIPHLAEHLAFQGTKAFPDSLKFKQLIEEDGTLYNAATSDSFVRYYFEGSNEHLFKIIPLNLGQIFDPLYDEKQVVQEQKVITREMNMYKENDGWRAYYATAGKMLPASCPDIDQRIAAIQTITRDDLLAYNQRYYTSPNTQFILAGNFSNGEIGKVIILLNQQLKSKSTDIAPQAVPQKLSDFGGTVQILDAYKDKQSTFSLNMALDGTNLADAVVLRVISVMLTAGLSAPLLRKSREQGLAYGISSSATVEYETHFEIKSQTGNEHILPLIELACQEVSAVRKGNFSDEAIRRANGYLVGTMKRNHQTPQAYAGWYVGRFIRGWPRVSPDEMYEQIMNVDRRAILEVASRYFTLKSTMLMLVANGQKDNVTEYQNMLNKYFA